MMASRYPSEAFVIQSATLRLEISEDNPGDHTTGPTVKSEEIRICFGTVVRGRFM